MKSVLVEIDITQLFPDPSQPRKVFDEKAIEALREDIKANGLTVPIDINPLLDGRKTKYLIIDGECRFHAIEGIDDFGMVPCKLHTYKSQRQIDKHRASVHFHRKDWNPADRAVWLKYYTETHKLRQQDLAREFSVTHATISQWLAPTRDPAILNALRMGDISFTQAMHLSRIDDAETRSEALLRAEREQGEVKHKTEAETKEIVKSLHSTPESDIKVKDAEVKERFAEAGESDQLPPVEDHPPSASETVDEGEGENQEEATPPPETPELMTRAFEREKGTEEAVLNGSITDSDAMLTTQSPLPEEGVTPDVPSPETEPPFIRKILKEFEVIKKLSLPDERKVVSGLNSDDLKTAIRKSRKTGENWLCLSARLRSASNGETYEMSKLISTGPWIESITVEKIIASKEIENAKSTLNQMKLRIDESLDLLAKRGS